MNKKNLKLIILGIFWTGIFICPASAEMSKSTARDLFVEAGKLYQSGKYTGAISKYEEILKGQRESGALYYNLGNSYYKEKFLGKAILNYQRAKRLIPRNRDLIFNQKYAFAQAGVVKNSGSLTFVQKVFEQHIQFYTKEEMVGIITVFFVLGMSFFLGSFYMTMTKNIRVLIISFFILGVSVFIVGFVLKCRQESFQAVTINKAKAYFEPRLNATVYYHLKEGDVIKTQQEQGDWTKIKRADGRLGWVQSSNIEGI